MIVIIIMIIITVPYLLPRSQDEFGQILIIINM